MLPTNNSPQNAFNLANPPTLPLSSSNGIFAIPSLPILPFPIPIISSFLHLPTFSSIFPQFPILNASEPPKIDDPPPVVIDESKNSSNLKSEEGNQRQQCPFRLCTISPDSVGQSSSSAIQSSGTSSSTPFHALLFDGPSPLMPGTRIEVPSNLRKFCHKTANREEANFCAKTGKIIRKISKGEELVMLAPNNSKKEKSAVNFGLTSEECAQIKENGDCGQGFSCHRCGKVFSYEYYRDKHLKFTPCVDNGLRRFPCALCPRSFEKRDRLRIHILHVHENHRPHICQICGKAFSQSSSLNKHLRTHSGERSYQCPHCSKAFTASSILRTHIRQHSGEKPFKCAQCGKCFASHAAHDSHIRRTHQIHSNE